MSTTVTRTELADLIERHIGALVSDLRQSSDHELLANARPDAAGVAAAAPTAGPSPSPISVHPTPGVLPTDAWQKLGELEGQTYSWPEGVEEYEPFEVWETMVDGTPAQIGLGHPTRRETFFGRERGYWLAFEMINGRKRLANRRLHRGGRLHVERRSSRGDQGQGRRRAVDVRPRRCTPRGLRDARRRRVPQPRLRPPGVQPYGCDCSRWGPSGDVHARLASARPAPAGHRRLSGKTGPVSSGLPDGLRTAVVRGRDCYRGDGRCFSQARASVSGLLSTCSLTSRIASGPSLLGSTRINSAANMMNAIIFRR